ncbi:hypothetical protein NPIL_246931 [Nephila pilipes]|uniref:Uncharacterized protein n=1 Tax=Nephila pilipes TaxID=299642 RepID=A0A8X6TQQ6_NEPPI|nr:hypothetical protein NPIL_246931 [Nephila pilipes]
MIESNKTMEYVLMEMEIKGGPKKRMMLFGGKGSILFLVVEDVGYKYPYSPVESVHCRKRHEKEGEKGIALDVSEVCDTHCTHLKRDDPPESPI